MSVCAYLCVCVCVCVWGGMHIYVHANLYGVFFIYLKVQDTVAESLSGLLDGISWLLCYSGLRI